MPLNADHCQSMPINIDQLRGIERNWLALIGIDRHWDQCYDFDRHWSALGIDRGSPDNDRLTRKNFFPLHNFTMYILTSFILFVVNAGEDILRRRFHVFPLAWKRSMYGVLSEIITKFWKCTLYQISFKFLAFLVCSNWMSKVSFGNKILNFIWQYLSGVEFVEKFDTYFLDKFRIWDHKGRAVSIIQTEISKNQLLVLLIIVMFWISAHP